MATMTSVRAASTRTLWTHRVFVANLVFEILIVATGGVVRLTESGLGYTTAPECVPGSIVPLAQQNKGVHTAIEFGNRMLSVLVGLIAVAALVAAIRSHRRSLIGWAATVLLIRSHESDATPRRVAPASARHLAIALAVNLGLLLLAGTVTTVAQIALGWGQYLTGLPIVPVALHMLGAALLTAATWVALSLRVRD